jgi:hypothetical protein
MKCTSFPNFRSRVLLIGTKVLFLIAVAYVVLEHVIHISVRVGVSVSSCFIK